MWQDCWDRLTDPILLKILYYLSPKDILNAGTTCSNWNRICYDEFLWHYQFCKHFKLDYDTELKPGQTSWYEEFKRLTFHAPLVETEILKSHSEPVLYVTFSHDGKYFVTCSMDGFVLVWNSTYPCNIKYAYDMKVFSWKYTQYAEFNETDTLLLVSGVHFGENEDTSGEIAVFSLEDGMSLICRILNKPFDIFGTFYNDEYIFSGQVKQIANLICSCSIWIHKAYADVTSEQKPLMSLLFRFMNVNASFIRTLLVAKCRSDVSALPGTSGVSSISRETAGEPNSKLFKPYKKNMPPSFFYEKNYKSVEVTDKHNSDTECTMSESTAPSDISSENDEELDTDTDDDLASQPEKYLIFTTGSKTNIPHQIGIKRIGQVTFPKKLDPGPSVMERIACRERANRPYDGLYGSSSDPLRMGKNYDSVDHLIELHGHVIGMKLSPDHRYLYVNCRPWPEDYIISNPLDSPPIAQEIDIHVIDLTTFKEVGKMLRTRRVYTPGDECFLIFLDVSNDYVASGSQDKHGYLWDRHYGIGLAKFAHGDIVNSVAFNPKDPEMLISVSDDGLIKVWRSRAQKSQLFTDISECPKTVEISPKRRVLGTRIVKNFRVIM
ncbi:F-box/WD repeat-containing protein 5 [Planococcus citri]|uniref:F-box/WD repeat-containing protein 5 n=1 Tax=Planococcus citri TaxID=170843 RepID=UPI0031FA3B85